MTIKIRLFANTVLSALVILILIIIGWGSMKSLAKLQDSDAELARRAEMAAMASKVGMSQYQAISDAIINRDLAKTDKEWNRKKELNAKRMDELVKAAGSAEEKQLATEAKNSFDVIINLYENKLRPLLTPTATITPEIQEIDGQMDKELEVIRVNTNKLAESLQKSAKEGDKAFDAAMKRSILWMLVIGIIFFIAQLAAAIFTTATIVRPINKLNMLVNDLAQGDGDLTKKVDYRGSDELGQLGGNLNLFIDKVHDIVKTVVKDSIQVVIGSNKVHVMADEISKETDNLATQATTVATASEEMSATSNDIAQNCMQAAEGGSVATSVAAEGSAIVQETVAGMERIAERVRNAATTVANLGARSDQIGTIVGTIQDIADQTNLLALNAAIEAARAGEQGRGFAVVADEVRALAERTSKATNEISNMIKSIQNETRSAVESMEEGVGEVEKGSSDAARSGEALQNITDQINSVNMQVSQIATAAEEQTATTSEISVNIQQITEIAKKASLGTHETTGAANELLAMSEELLAVLGKFKINEDLSLVLNRAKSAHMLFVGKIRAHLDGHKRVDGDSLPTHLTCAFGKWCQSDGRETCGNNAVFREIDAPHAKVHDLGKQAISAYNAGDRNRAAALCEEMTIASANLITILERLERDCRG